MKKITAFLFSPKTSLFLLILFAAAIATATFIEEKYDTVTAKLLIYNAKWFEVLLIILALNFAGNISRYKLFRKEKLPLLSFHLAFILLIIGAGITRYIGFEGNMHIREGESSGVIYSSEPYLQIHAEGEGVDFHYEQPCHFSEAFMNPFSVKIDGGVAGDIKITYKDYFKNAVEKVKENVENGATFIEMVIGDESGKINVLLKDGEIKDFGKVALAFNNTERADAIIISEKEGGLFIYSPYGIVRTTMHGTVDSTGSEAEVPVNDSLFLFDGRYLYETMGIVVLPGRTYKNARKELVRGSDEESGSEMLAVNVTGQGREQEVMVPATFDFQSSEQAVTFNGVVIKIAYGNKEIPLPFSLYLDDFTLDRYAGSMSPSSYASNVTLTDVRDGTKESQKIYMNHVLDHGGYRFFQSSYDLDEKGTILSVNHDSWGTWISYTGYILLGIGFLLTLLSRKSRFRFLRHRIRSIREKRRSMLIAIPVILFGAAFSGHSQNPVQAPVSPGQADNFGHLVVQTFDGRFEPVNTLAFDVIHKLSRKDHIHTDKGDMDAMQVFLDMLIDPAFWKQQKIILVREKSIRDILGTQGKYASFNDFIDQGSTYKLSSYAEKAFRKEPGERNTFDKEIMKVDERVNIFISLINGSMLRLFPSRGSSNNKWLSIADSMAHVPLTGIERELADGLQAREGNYHSLLMKYLFSVFEGTKSGDYSQANNILAGIENIQRMGTPGKLLPSASMVGLEINYNRSGIFIFLRNIYGFLAIILLVLAFIENLGRKPGRMIKIALYVFTGLLGAAFLYHTYGMAIRWYLSGHAPWSNGYEALLLIAWASLFAGFIFIRNSKITVAATAFLAFSILMTASHSSYNPQLTNLQPVLKSYWLVIHVAVITISYGFLALGFILGIINICLFLFSAKEHAERSGLLLEELTCTNEISLTIGLFLATLGTFLGGVWANESWGRYWGWDAKETWALVIVITYAIILHLRLVPKFKNAVLFNAGSVIAFGSVIMTFVGVNYYLSKGLHSYAADDKTVFPLWGWMIIGSIAVLIASAWIKELRQAGKTGSLLNSHSKQ